MAHISLAAVTPIVTRPSHPGTGTAPVGVALLGWGMGTSVGLFWRGRDGGRVEDEGGGRSRGREV